jgi:hypothetical protein
VSGAAAMMQALGGAGQVLRGTATASSGTTSLTLAKPTGTVAGDFLLAVVNYNH